MLNSDTLSQLKQFKQDLRLANNRFEGSVRATPGRFGFCQLDDGRDVYLNPDQMLRLLPGDRILIEVKEDEKGRLIGDLIELLRSDIRYLVGSIVSKGQALFINADFGNSQRWLFIPPKNRKHLAEGLLVVGKLSQHPFKDGKAQVEVAQILGKPDKPGIQTDYALNKHHINPKTKGGPDRHQLQTLLDEGLSKRQGFHEVPFLTIDAESTLDIDDALYCETTENGWLLTVAIADPTAFFPATDPLDSQALSRGQSLYFPDRTVGMLPDNLATQFASLVAEKPRLALLVKMQISAAGKITSSEILEGGITVKQRLTYERASELLTQSAEPAEPVSATLQTLQHCAAALFQNRHAEALISPDRPDYRFIFDEHGQVSDIVVQYSTPAHRIVEESMIAANRCAARFLTEHSPSALYSVHQGFRTDRVEQIRNIVKEQYPDFDTQSITALEGFKSLMTFLESNGSQLPLRAIATRLMNRSVLSELPGPHFGMGLPVYTTFTSPIRRYVDLIVHRNIKSILANQKTHWLSGEGLQQLQERLRVGRQAMNDAESWLKIRFADTLKGQTLSGHIVQTNGSGFVVRTDQHGIEGYVNLAQEAEKFRFDGTYFQHIGAERQFRLEQPVQVVIQETDLANRQVLFSLISPETQQQQ